MKKLIQASLLGLSCLWASTGMAIGPGGGATGIYVASITTVNNDGSGTYYASFDVSGPTLSACQTALDDAILAYASTAWSWTYCTLKSIDSYFDYGVIVSPAVSGGGSGGSSGNAGIVNEIAVEVSNLASQYDLGGYQNELDRLDARYGINEYKSEMIKIYRQATRRSTRK